MDKLTSLWSQIHALGMYLHQNTKLKITTIFDGDADSYMMTITNNNGETIYTHSIEGISVKATSMVEFDMKQLINYLLELKKLKENEKNKQ